MYFFVLPLLLDCIFVLPLLLDCIRYLHCCINITILFVTHHVSTYYERNTTVLGFFNIYFLVHYFFNNVKVGILFVLKYEIIFNSLVKKTRLECNFILGWDVIVISFLSHEVDYYRVPSLFFFVLCNFV